MHDLGPFPWLALLAALMLPAASPAPSPPPRAAPDHDVVLAGGRVMDPETGLDAVRHVGIVGSEIVAVSEAPLDGAVVVNVTGLVVAPGFVDLHAHGQDNRSNEFQARDGVTTALEMEGGVPDVTAFLEGRRGEALLNYGATVSHGMARTRAMPQYAEATPTPEEELTGAIGWDRDFMSSRYEALDPAHYPELRRRLAAALRDGALGIGMAHQYYPGATREEIFRVFQMAAEWKAPIHTHVRDMSLDAFQEVLANATVTGAPLHVVHVNSSSMWHVGTVLEMIGAARERGIDVTTEAYPYTAGSTLIESAIFDAGWRERLRIDYGDVQWQATGERLTEETFDSYRAEGGVVIIHMMRPEWIDRAMGTPFVMVASDGMPYDPGAHPRSAGTFSRVLGRYVRERGVMTLMEALGKITLMPAERVAGIAPMMRRKGRIQVGADADVTVFDPETVIDTATFEEDLSFSRGVEHVLVNGTFVVRDGRGVEGARPGRAIVGVGPRR